MGSYLRREMMRWLNRTFGRAPQCLVIGDHMAREYQRRYQVNCIPFMNCLDEAAFSVGVRPALTTTPLRLVYIGGLHLNRWKSLMEVGAVLSELAQQGTPSELIIHTYPQTEAEYGALLTANPLIRMGGWVRNEDVPRIVADADCLVHVESFDQAIREYTRFSVSTKLPEYMMAGRCIFAYGPQECASMLYVEESKVGLTVSDQSRQSLRDALAVLLKSPETRQEYATRGRALALERHEAARQRERFRQVLLDVAHEWRAQHA
jgi:glycosyltransferase involved in cell wall biosynthesis